MKKTDAIKVFFLCDHISFLRFMMTLEREREKLFSEIYKHVGMIRSECFDINVIIIVTRLDSHE